jgi:hypothetical protein
LKAEVAILVVSAARGEFEAGFDLGGQTREHALLVRSLGVGHVIVAINKMDMVKRVCAPVLPTIFHQTTPASCLRCDAHLHSGGLVCCPFRRDSGESVSLSQIHRIQGRGERERQFA